MTQCDAILEHLKRGRVVSHFDAERHFGVCRLAARICDLRARGHDIRRRMVPVRTRTGHTRVAIYWLSKEA